MFVKPDQVKLMLQASQSLGLTGRFVWVMASDWDQDTTQIAGFEQEVRLSHTSSRAALIPFCQLQNFASCLQEEAGVFLFLLNSLNRCCIGYA